MPIPAPLPWLGLLLWALLPLAAHGEPDTFWLGDGHHGPLSVPSGTRTINPHAPLAATASAGSTEVSLADSSGFQPGDLILLHQTVSALPDATMGESAPITLEDSSVGRFELARVQEVSGSRLLLQAPLVHPFEPPGAQVVLVPEYTEVTIASGATLAAPEWDGASGGVLALLVTGAVRNDGLMSANASGLRGGQHVNDSNHSRGCTGLSESPPLGAWRGESFVAGRFGSGESGYGNLANGGGGGVCHNSGGGGGGHGGPGGRGARTASIDDSRPYGGLGGSALDYSLVERLMLGGGGGGGQGNNGVATGGGHGGGIILLRSSSLTGSGRVTANGESAAEAGRDGAGGGGAGGCLSVRVVGTLAQAALEAHGGTGGSTTWTDDGPGGGGGGGRVLIQGGDTAQAPVSVLAGEAGRHPGSSQTYGEHHGAEPDTEADPAFVGISSPLPGALALPPAPVILHPEEGLLTHEARPSVSGTSLSSATLILLVDGVEVSRTTADDDGGYTFNLTTDLAEGLRQLQVVAEYQGLRGPPASRSLTLELIRSPYALTVGCGCGGAPGAGGGAGLALWVLGAVVLWASRRSVSR